MSKRKSINCHKCPNKGTDKCIACKKVDEDTKHKQYLLEGYEPPQPDTSGSEQVTNLPDDVEDKMRKFLFDMFDLDWNELMLLKATMNSLSLTEFGQQMEQLSKQNWSFSRFRAFQTRKRLLRKLGDGFAGALLTMGQKKPLKKEDR